MTQYVSYYYRLYQIPGTKYGTMYDMIRFLAPTTKQSTSGTRIGGDLFGVRLLRLLAASTTQALLYLFSTGAGPAVRIIINLRPDAQASSPAAAVEWSEERPG